MPAVVSKNCVGVVCETCTDAVSSPVPGPAGYTECCFTSRGTGQFKPGDSANPHVGQPCSPVLLVRCKANSTQIGKVGELEEVDEYRVEAICLGRDTMVKAVEALKR